ncbi:PaaX domain-containing protein, partial [Streptomyces viridosporus ATCC 14672]
MRMDDPTPPDDPRPRPLSARSVVLSLLLGTHPPELATRELGRLVEGFDVGGSTLRAALSRMVAAGDLLRTDTGYRLSDRLVRRQHRQDEAVRPRTREWDGDWEMVVITATGRGPAERADTRAQLAALRLAELREGVWLRPANLSRPLPAGLDRVARLCTARPAGPARGTGRGPLAAGRLGRHGPCAPGPRLTRRPPRRPARPVRSDRCATCSPTR